MSSQKDGIINLDIEVRTAVKKQYALNKAVADQLAAYVEAARLMYPGVDENTVVNAILERQINGDRKYKKYLRERNNNNEYPVSEEPLGNGA